MKYGVPQGSILGRILFCLCTASLPTMVNYLLIYLYADDTQLLKSFQSNRVSQALDQVIEDLNNITKWSKGHGLCLNASKTCVLIIGTEYTKNRARQYNFTTLHIKHNAIS